MKTVEDLLEEIFRLYDYNRVIGQLPQVNSQLLANNNSITKKNALANYLSAQGAQEIITYSLVAETELKPETNSYRLLTPKNEQHVGYRHSLQANHWRTIKRNCSHQQDQIFFYELAELYSPEKEPEEVLALSATGQRLQQKYHQLQINWDLSWLQGIAENLLEIFGTKEKVNFIPEKNNRLVLINQEGEQLGFLEAEKQLINQQPKQLFFAQLSLTKLTALTTSKRKYQPLNNLPISERDLTFLVIETKNYQEIINSIHELGGVDLLKVNLLDAYQSPALKKQKRRSLSFRLTFQGKNQTLTKAEVEEQMKKIITGVKSNFEIQVI